MRNLRFILLIPLAVALVVWSALIRTPVALANPDCNHEDSIFWTATDGNHHWLGGQAGDREEHLLTDRDLADGCALSYESVSVTHVDETIDQADWVETGWFEFEECDGCTHHFNYFIEAGINYNTIDGTPIEDVFPCTYNVGGYATFIAERKSTADDWHAKMSCGDGTGFHDLGSMNNTGHNNGYPGVEVSRFGGAGTGMSDVQNNLSYQNSVGGTYSLFPNFKCLKDYQSSGTNNWNGEHQSGSTNDFDTYKDTTNVCPQP